MKLATLRSGQVIALDDEHARSVTVTGAAGRDGESMIDVITHYGSGLDLAGEQHVSPEDFAAPVLSPTKIWAAASNYERRASGLGRGARGAQQEWTKQERLSMTFMKPPTAIVGPGDSIVLPSSAGAVFPEVELCVVIGERCRGLTSEQAKSAIFGYTIIIDVTARDYGRHQTGRATRCVRKGHDTFAPLGPYITTADAIRDPQQLDLKLWVNDELRQSASTASMINNVYELVSFLSNVCTLEPGDLIATGNPDSPEHQQELLHGDVLVAEIEGIGQLQLDVRAAGP